MKIEDIMLLDCRVKEDRIALQKALRQIPKFESCEKGSKVPLEGLEDLYNKMAKKYPIRISYIMPIPDKESQESYYSTSILDTRKSKHLKTVHSKTVYEAFAKVVCFVFAYIKKLKEEQNEN